MMATHDQKSCARNPLAFATRKLVKVQKQCGAGATVNDIWLVVNFALYDLKLIEARRQQREKKQRSRRATIRKGLL
jgi:hypothetical protein